LVDTFLILHWTLLKSSQNHLPLFKRTKHFQECVEQKGKKNKNSKANWSKVLCVFKSFWCKKRLKFY
jgi:hypothetical protein